MQCIQSSFTRSNDERVCGARRFAARTMGDGLSMVRYAIFGIFKDMDIVPVVALLVAAHVVEADWGARPDLEWFSYTFDEAMIFVPPALAPLKAGQRLLRVD